MLFAPTSVAAAAPLMEFDKLKFAAAGITPPGGSGLHSCYAEVSTDVTVKGWGFGLTYKF